MIYDSTLIIPTQSAQLHHQTVQPSEYLHQVLKLAYRILLLLKQVYPQMQSCLLSLQPISILADSFLAIRNKLQKNDEKKETSSASSSRHWLDMFTAKIKIYRRLS